MPTLKKQSNLPKRCAWVEEGNTLYENYHDTEWGVPVFDDRVLFEFLILEGAQAGLSWITILKKREGYRKAFKNFNPQQVAKMTAADIKNLMQNESVVRNRLKLESVINNAKAFIKIQKEYGGFSAYIWGFVDGKPIQNKHESIKDVPAVTPLAEKISKDLKKRGFRFVGPTIVYAFMQAVGIVNDHTVDCFRHKKLPQM